MVLFLQKKRYALCFIFSSYLYLTFKMDFVKHFPICVVLFVEKTDINCNMFEYTAH